MTMPNGWSMMASYHIEQSWGQCRSTFAAKTTGAKYLGWSYDYAGAEIADVHHDNPPSPSGIPQSATQSTGVPDTYYYMRQQVYVSLPLFLICFQNINNSFIYCFCVRPLCMATLVQLMVS